MSMSDTRSTTPTPPSSANVSSPALSSSPRLFTPPPTSLLVRQSTLHRPSRFQPRKQDILRVPQFNKSTAFTREERDQLGLRGLIPPRYNTLEEQLDRSLHQLRSFDKPLEKYIYLEALRTRNETLYYAVLTRNLTECMPIVYTPTVGLACVEYSHIWRSGSGMFFTKDDQGMMREMLDHWPAPSVDIIVVTDGSRILGLGDLGCSGMGIPIGKLSLYVAGAGFHPSTTLPVMLDFGTNNKAMREDPQYIGMPHPRVSDDEYYPLIDEFMQAVYDKWPWVLVQFEDFSNEHCFNILERYRHHWLCFNDDIQGTGAVILSGFINAVKVSGVKLGDHRIVFHGAGSAGTGVADQIAAHIASTLGVSLEAARAQFWFVDTKGMITADRGDVLAPHKVDYARSDNAGVQCATLLATIKHVRPTALIGLSGDPGAFTQEMIEFISSYLETPLVFALSNPTSKAECTLAQATTWSKGKALFISGSPFDPFEYEGKTHYASQGNNMYIFPGLGRGAQLCRASAVSDAMVLAAATTLANQVSDQELAERHIYPPLASIRQLSCTIAVNVIKCALSEGLVRLKGVPAPEQLFDFVSSSMYEPSYLSSI